MQVKKLVVTMAALGAMALSVTSQAAVFRWTFNTLEQNDIAFLDFDTVTSDFRLFDNSANNYLSSPIGINGVSFDFVSAQTLNPTAATSAGLFGNVSIGTLSATTQPALITGFQFGFATANNGDANEINNGEGTMFNFGAIAFSNFDNVAIRLNASNGALNSSGTWVGGTLVQQTPVPEAETGAMMALGLGVLGFVARRRKQA